MVDQVVVTLFKSNHFLCLLYFMLFLSCRIPCNGSGFTCQRNEVCISYHDKRMTKDCDPAISQIHTYVHVCFCNLYMVFMAAIYFLKCNVCKQYEWCAVILKQT